MGYCYISAEDVIAPFLYTSSMPCYVCWVPVVASIDVEVESVRNQKTRLPKRKTFQLCKQMRQIDMVVENNVIAMLPEFPRYISVSCSTNESALPTIYLIFSARNEYFEKCNWFVE